MAKGKAGTEVPAQTKKVGKPVNEAYEEYDRSTFIPKRIKEGLKQLGSGRFLREQEFMALCDVRHTTAFASYRDQFKEHWVMVNRYGAKAPHRLWFGDKRDAEAFRDRIGIQMGAP